MVESANHGTNCQRMNKEYESPTSTNLQILVILELDRPLIHRVAQDLVHCTWSDNFSQVATKERSQLLLAPVLSPRIVCGSRVDRIWGIDMPPDTTISMPSRTERFGLITSFEFTMKISPI